VADYDQYTVPFYKKAEMQWHDRHDKLLPQTTLFSSTSSLSVMAQAVL
jgi:hypothetical protein